MFGLPYLLLPLPPLVVRSDLSEEIDGGNWLFKIGIEYLVNTGKRRILSSSVRVVIFYLRYVKNLVGLFPMTSGHHLDSPRKSFLNLPPFLSAFCDTGSAVSYATQYARKDLPHLHRSFYPIFRGLVASLPARLTLSNIASQLPGLPERP